MSTAQTGARRERQVRDDMAADGWVFGMRAAASKGAADLLMAHPEYGAALVQVGSKSKTLGPADRERLCDLADLCGALALLAIVVPRQPVTYWQVTRQTPSRWTRWQTTTPQETETP
jgi:hypothetical protein